MRSIPNPNDLTHFSVFSGIGGIDLASEWAGFRTVGQIEIDSFCTQVLSRHWPDIPRWRDVNKVTGQDILNACGHITLLSGGFPCQPVSVAGRQKGTEDERWLWDELYRLIHDVKPRWVLAENVCGLLSVNNGQTFGDILSNLADSGYNIGWASYGAKDIGAPHQRNRVFIVGHLANGKPNKIEKDTEKDLTEKEDCIIKPEIQDMLLDIDNISDETHSFPHPATDHRWPAPPGPQYDWEPPRRTAESPMRRKRLSALGNAVVPQQVYPLLAAIARQEQLRTAEQEEILV